MIDLCGLARQSLQHWLSGDHQWIPQRRSGKRSACFVSLHTADGALRGCVGTLLPVADDLALEVSNNAISAATRDPRFPPISLIDLDQLTIQINVLGEPEACVKSQLDPQIYGVIVANGNRRGVLLPNLQGIDDCDQQLDIARKKALIGPHEPVELSRFETDKFSE